MENLQFCLNVKTECPSNLNFLYMIPHSHLTILYFLYVERNNGQP